MRYPLHSHQHSYPILSHHWGCTKPASVDGQDNQSTQAMFHIHPKLLIGILALESYQGEPWLSDWNVLKHGSKPINFTYFYINFTVSMRDDNLQR